MIKFKAQGSDGPLLGFGLSEENIQKLKQGQPIAVDLAEMGCSRGRVLIFYGRTEKEMAQDLREFIGPETIMHGDIP